MSTLILSHTDCLKHIEPAGHPEQVKRLEKVLDVLKLSIFNDLTWKEAPLAKKEQIALCHSSDYINKIEKIYTSNSPDITLSTANIFAPTALLAAANDPIPKYVSASIWLGVFDV